MIVIADSGSTKTEWAFVQKDGSRTVMTSGINPVHMSAEEISGLLSGQLHVPQEELINIQAVYFYGAGCIPSKCAEVSGLLCRFFETARVSVESDLLGAARGLLGKQAGVACILGTGSNSALYDGEQIVRNVWPLGFILGDEGSGANLGKRFIGDLLKGRLSRDITDSFFREYPSDYNEIIESVYRKPGANRFLAQFCPFLYQNIQHDSISSLVESAFSEFVDRNLLQYEGIKKLSVSFTGSVAFYFKPQLRKVLQSYGLTFGGVERSPMPGLIRYHNHSKPDDD